MNEKRYGLIEDLIELGAYIFGGAKVPTIPYQEDGNWEAYLPTFEHQKTKAREETSGCTVFGSLSQIETLYKRLYGTEPNYSERFTYLNVPIDPAHGTDPQRTYEAIRKHGLVEESQLPMTETLEEYLDDSDITGSLRAKGQYWLTRHEFLHEWLWTYRPDNYLDVLREALKTSPLGVSVSAWNKEGDVYVSTGKVNNHFCLLYKFDKDGYPWVYDTYENAKKKLAKDHNIRRAKRIWINRKTISALKKHRNILEVILDTLTMRKSLLQLVEDHIGTDASPSDLAPDELGCAESVSTILNKYESGRFNIVTGTYSLYDMLLKRTDYERVPVPMIGSIVISPTGTSTKKGAVGHTGFVLENGVIASNDSKTGKFLKNFTVDTWNAYYKDKLAFPVYYFIKK